MHKNKAQLLISTLANAGHKAGDRLVVGVSGGPDSLALLHQLLSLLDASSLCAAHLDHSIRPGSADDARFVAEKAGEWGVEIRTKRVDVPDLAKQNRLSMEEAGRVARYEFLAEVALAVGARIVAVGHNLDDQVETVLHHFLRGSGLTGLRGMQPVGAFPGMGELTLIRPLLDQSRAEIEAYCEKHGLEPVVDESNTDPAYMRNRIRHHLLPELETYNPQIRSHLVQLAAIISAEDDLLSAQFDAEWPALVIEDGRGWLSLDRRRFQDLPLALQRRAVRRTVEILHGDTSDLSFRSVEQAVEIATRRESGIETVLCGGLSMLADYDTLLFSAADVKRPCRLPQLSGDGPLPLPVPGRVEMANGWILSAELVSQGAEMSDLEKNPWLAYANLPAGASLIIRPRRSGERMQPLGMKGHSTSLQDIMVNRKLSSRFREGWPLVATEHHVVWLTGHIIDERVRVSESSRHVVRLSMEHPGGEK